MLGSDGPRERLWLSMHRHRLCAIAIIIFPVILTIGILIIPVVSDYSNHLLAEQAANKTVRWFWGHLISTAAFGISILAAYSIHLYLSSRGQARSGIISLSLIAIGAALYAFGLGADGIGPLATDAGGGRALTFFEGSGIWVMGVFVSASVVFGLGIVTQVIGLLHTNLLKGIVRVIVFIAAVVFIAAAAIPSGWGLYVVAGAALVVYLPIGSALWRESIEG